MSKEATGTRARHGSRTQERIKPLLHRQLLGAGGPGFFRQAELQHAILVFGLRLAVVDFLRQREAAILPAVIALAMDYGLALLFFRFLAAPRR